ncbi:protachykinin-1-like [Pseudophryne corroboree]|uniref:protachykinin-1-like n=1 Tax=Pseudophryne corroboree TaxID=495146 RepID=UPI0030816B21
MNMAVACLVFFLAATQALTEEMEWTEGSHWPSNDQYQADLEEPTYDKYMLRIARNRNPEKFYGLPGKRDIGYKAGNFIGLMGKRSLSSESAERKTDLDFYRRRK